MAGILRLKNLLDRAKRLPVVGQLSQLAADAGVRGLVDSPAAERAAAISGLVPKRCGLCRHFNHEAGQAAAMRSEDFMKAMGILGPDQMSRPSNEPAPNRASAAARALRPHLNERFEDYGGCMKYSTILWAFEEQPNMPESTGEPCSSWE